MRHSRIDYDVDIVHAYGSRISKEAGGVGFEPTDRASITIVRFGDGSDKPLRQPPPTQIESGARQSPREGALRNNSRIGEGNASLGHPRFSYGSS